ncbi:hypothetical protein GOV08_02600 [Candidatus Woesearchaeota archaeon]|nr:hypothetical protein [Candidatus Woesearchaeota archaeon]
MAEKIMCRLCKVEKEPGMTATNNSMIYWQKGKPGLFKGLFTKAEPVISYACPKCGGIEMIKVKKEK